MPSSSGPFASLPGSSLPGAPLGGAPRKSHLVPILLILLGFGTFAFGALTVLYAGKASTASRNANARVEAAAKKAADDQKAADDAATAAANGSPFRAYSAPVTYGSFVIAFPKNWSSYVDEEVSGKQVELILNPDFIRKTKSQEEPQAARIIYQDGTQNNYPQQFAGQVKQGKMKQADIKVSGQSGLDFTGTFPDNKTVRMVIVPIRDKVLIFSTENPKYATEFGQILSQSKLVP